MGFTQQLTTYWALQESANDLAGIAILPAGMPLQDQPQYVLWLLYCLRIFGAVTMLGGTAMCIFAASRKVAAVVTTA